MATTINPNDIISHAASRGSVARSDGTREVVEHWSPLCDVMEPDADPWIDEALERVAEQVDDLIRNVRTMSRPELRYQEICRQLRHLVDKQRQNTFLASLRYQWHEAENPWEALKRLLAITRRVKPEFIKGVSQQEVALLLRETVRATVSAREKRVFEELMVRFGMRGFLGAGGVKSASSRKKFAKVQQGNHSRRKGERRKRRAKRAELSRKSQIENDTETPTEGAPP